MRHRNLLFTFPDLSADHFRLRFIESPERCFVSPADIFFIYSNYLFLDRLISFRLRPMYVASEIRPLCLILA